MVVAVSVPLVGNFALFKMRCLKDFLVMVSAFFIMHAMKLLWQGVLIRCW